MRRLTWPRSLGAGVLALALAAGIAGSLLSAPPTADAQSGGPPCILIYPPPPGCEPDPAPPPPPGRPCIAIFPTPPECLPPAPPPPPAPPSPPCILIFPPPPGCGGGSIPPAPPLPLPRPVPPAPPVEQQPDDSVRVTTDQPVYRAGDPVTATVWNGIHPASASSSDPAAPVSNAGATAPGARTIHGGGGYVCGFVQVEVLRQGVWVQAPGGSEFCPLIAHALRPGESRVETFDAGPEAGAYRLAVSFTTDDGGPFTVYSEPFQVP